VIWAFYHTSQTSKSQFRRFETERPSVIIRKREIESVIKRPPSLGWGIMSRMAWSTRTTRKRRKRTMSRCTTLRPAVTAAPRLHNAPRECAIRMPRGKVANTGARGPITPATGPGQASTRFCNLAEALLATGATFGFKVAKSVSSFCVLQLHNDPGADDRRHGDRGQKIGDDCSSAVAIPPSTRAHPFAVALDLECDASLCEVSAALCRVSDDEWACFVGSKGIVFGAHDGRDAHVTFHRACRLATSTNVSLLLFF